MVLIWIIYIYIYFVLTYFGKYYLVHKASLVQIFLRMFISFLYMFRATIWPSSGDTTVFMRHLVLVILCG